MNPGIVEFRVRYAETDQMGVVYHPNYLIWCEIGRTDLMRACGAPYSELERGGLLLAVAEANLRYAAAARYDDLVRVTTSVRRVQSRSVTFRYTIQRVEPAPALPLATAETRLLAVGRDFVPRTIPPAILDRFRELLDAT